jgi:hypothetical protein
MQATKSRPLNGSRVAGSLALISVSHVVSNFPTYEGPGQLWGIYVSSDNARRVARCGLER